MSESPWRFSANLRFCATSRKAHFNRHLRTRERIPSDLRAEIAAGRVRAATATVGEMRVLGARFTPDFRERLHAGELEALAYLEAHSAEDLGIVLREQLSSHLLERCAAKGLESSEVEARTEEVVGRWATGRTAA